MRKELRDKINLELLAIKRGVSLEEVKKMKRLVDNLRGELKKERNLKRKINYLRKRNKDPILLRVLIFIHHLHLHGIPSFPIRREEQLVHLLKELGISYVELFNQPLSSSTFYSLPLKEKRLEEYERVISLEELKEEESTSLHPFIYPSLIGLEVSLGDKPLPKPKIGCKEREIIHYNSVGLMNQIRVRLVEAKAIFIK